MPNDNQQPISDDQELAKVLAGIDQQNAPEEPVIETTQIPTPVSDEPSLLPDPIADPAPVVEEPALSPVEPTSPVVAPSLSGSLDSVKQEALTELRPLVDKLNVSAEEKFDTYLLLLRSTDDKDLIAPAHEAAKGITDEARRAQALLDIIKEIDFLSQGQK